MNHDRSFTVEAARGLRRHRAQGLLDRQRPADGALRRI